MVQIWRKDSTFAGQFIADVKQTPKLKLHHKKKGGLAQLARALAWHARGHRFDSVILHKPQPTGAVFLFLKGQCF